MTWILPPIDTTGDPPGPGWYPPFQPVPVQQGWLCPKCQRGVAPWMAYCPACAPSSPTTTGTVGSVSSRGDSEK